MSYRKAIILLAVIALTSCSAGSRLKADPEIDKLLGSAAQDESANRLDDAEKKLNAAIEKAEAANSLSLPLMQALDQTADFYKVHGQQEKSQKLYSRSRDIGDELSKGEDVSNANDFLREHIAALHGLANCERDLGGLRVSMALYERAIALQRQLKSDTTGDSGQKLENDYQEALRQQKIQTEVEQNIATGNVHVESKKVTDARKKQYMDKLNSLGDRLGTEDIEVLKKEWMELAQFAQSRYGVRDKRYREPMTGLLAVSIISGDFSQIDRITDADLQTFKALDETIKKDGTIEQSDITEVVCLIDHLTRKADLCLEKHDIECADRTASRALQMIEKYYSQEKHQQYRTMEVLSEAKFAMGDLDQAQLLEEEIVAKRKDEPAHVLEHLYILGEIELAQGDNLKVLGVVSRLSVTDKLRAVMLSAKVAESLGNYIEARTLLDRAKALLRPSSDDFASWNSTIAYTDARIDLKTKKYREAADMLIGVQRKPEFLPVIWLRESCSICYAQHKLGERKRVQALLQEIEEHGRGKSLLADNTFLSQIVRVSLAAREKTKLKLEMDRLLSLWNELTFTGKDERIWFLEELASELASSGQNQEAIQLFKVILQFYERVPNRTDVVLVQSLDHFHKLLVREKRLDEAKAIELRLNKKRKQLDDERKLVAKVMKTINFD